MVFLLGGATLLKIYSSLGRYASERQRSAGRLAFCLFVGAVPFILLIIVFGSQCGSSLSCFSFETILRHEIGHVLGMDHPDIEGVSNLDSDSRDKNHIPINPQNPCLGLQMNSKRYWNSIMVSHGNRNTRMHKLAHDELGALHFLYPHEQRSLKRDRIPFEWMSHEKLRSWGASRGVLDDQDTRETLLNDFKGKDVKEWLKAMQSAEEEQHCIECLEDLEQDEDLPSEEL